MAFEKKEFYVLGRDQDGSFWVLGSYDQKAQAEQSIRWQNNTLRPQTYWTICNWVNGAFVPLTGGKIDFPLRPLPYTKRAYAEAMMVHGIDPKHMVVQ